MALSRIEVDKPTVILYITFVSFLSSRSSLAFQKLGVQRGVAGKFNVNFLKRLFLVLCFLNLAQNLRSKFDPFTFFRYFEMKLKFTKKEKNDQISKVEI